MIGSNEDGLDPSRAELDANGSPAFNNGLADGILIRFHAGGLLSGDHSL